MKRTLLSSLVAVSLALAAQSVAAEEAQPVNPGAAGAGVQQPYEDPGTAGQPGPPEDIDAADAEGTEEVAPDNSGTNVRDRSGDTVTPIDQGNSPEDLRITQSIRKAVASDDDLSLNAHNVKIVTLHGVVTLRGPVNDAAERAAIETKAKSVAGVRRVENQIEIASQ